MTPTDRSTDMPPTHQPGPRGPVIGLVGVLTSLVLFWVMFLGGYMSRGHFFVGVKILMMLVICGFLYWLFSASPRR